MAVKDVIHVLLDQGSFVELDAAKSCGVVTGLGTVQSRPVSILAVEKAVLGASAMERMQHLLEKTLMVGSQLVLLFEDEESVSDACGLMHTIRQLVRLSGVCPILALVCRSKGELAGKILPYADFCVCFDFEGEKAGCHTLPAADLPEGIEMLRTLLSLLPLNCAEEATLLDAGDELNRPCTVPPQCSAQDLVKAMTDTDSMFLLYSDQHAMAALARVGGRVAGILASADDALPFDAARFVQFCDCYSLPFVCVCEACLPYQPQLVYVLARATMPKVMLSLHENDNIGLLFDVVLSPAQNEVPHIADDHADLSEMRCLLINVLELFNVKRDVLPPHKHGNAPM